MTESAAPPPDMFPGWTLFFNVINAVLAQARAARLDVDALDYHNEVNPYQFSVVGRLLYDNKSGVDVMGTVRNLMPPHGFNSSRVTVSVVKDDPTPANHDCGSFYSDSAMLMKSSSVLAAFAGTHGTFGDAPTNWVGGLPSNDRSIPIDVALGRMDNLPVSYPVPTVIDIHSQAQYPTASETATWSRNFSSNVWSFLVAGGLTGNKVMFGETNPGEGEFCTEWSTTQANAKIFGYFEQGGYKQSTLFKNAAGNVVMQPWHRSEHGFSVPCVIKPARSIRLSTRMGCYFRPSDLNQEIVMKYPAFVLVRLILALGYVLHTYPQAGSISGTGTDNTGESRP